MNNWQWACICCEAKFETKEQVERHWTESPKCYEGSEWSPIAARNLDDILRAAPSAPDALKP